MVAEGVQAQRWHTYFFPGSCVFLSTGNEEDDADGDDEGDLEYGGDEED